ncbi:MAG TPA: DUF4198 domain-containing protein [Burkholderiaceae bacterium]|nr:DUF4198 domain-containing protein [Burkholderiaceae bacterium]
MTRALCCLVFALGGVASNGVAAHDTWLQPRRASVLPGTIAQIDLTSGDKFATFEAVIKADRVATARFRLNGKTSNIPPGSPEKKSLELRAPLSEPGVATLWVSLAPKSAELNRKEVQHYLDEIDAPSLLTQAWYAGTKAKTAKPWREVYSKHAKTFVRVGRPKSDLSWQEPVGMPLEVVPEKDPTALRAGDEFPVRVLKNGSPLMDFSLGILREGKTNRAFKKTDAAGRAVFRIARAGKWLLRGTELRSSHKPGTDWESDFTTLYFEVQ